MPPPGRRPTSVTAAAAWPGSVYAAAGFGEHEADQPPRLPERPCRPRAAPWYIPLGAGDHSSDLEDGRQMRTIEDPRPCARAASCDLAGAGGPIGIPRRSKASPRSRCRPSACRPRTTGRTEGFAAPRASGRSPRRHAPARRRPAAAQARAGQGRETSSRSRFASQHAPGRPGRPATRAEPHPTIDPKPSCIAPTETDHGGAPLETTRYAVRTASRPSR